MEFPMEFRSLHECDESVVRQTAQLLNSEWRKSEAARIQSLASSSSRGLPCSLVLLENTADCDKVIGHGRLSQVLGQPSSVVIESVIVVKDRRGCGLGKKIMQECESHAFRLGYTTCYLSTHDKCAFYEHLGYSYCSSVSPARAAVKLLEHQQILDLQTHFGEKASVQVLPEKERTEATMEPGSQQCLWNHADQNNGGESLDVITPVRRHGGGDSSFTWEENYHNANQITATEKSGLLLQDTLVPPCPPPPPPPPPQVVHTTQETSEFWMMKKLTF